MFKRVLPYTLLLAVAVTATPVRAQVDPYRGEQTLYRQVFPKPTGQNGYEEIILAAELVQMNKALEVAYTGTPTLSQKRAALNDRSCVEALKWLRRGLKKPIFSPRKEMTFDTSLPELAPLRSLARLLAVEQYVLLADGRTRDAINSMRDGFMLARVVQRDHLIGGLVGIAITTLVVRPIGSHLDQLSATDCEYLYQVCTQWLQSPSPLAAVIEGERRGSRMILQDILAQPARAQQLFADGGDEDEPDPDTERIRKDLQATGGDPARFKAEVERAMGLFDAYYGDLIRRLDQPPWQRTAPPVPIDDSLGGRLVQMLAPSMDHVLVAFNREQTLVQLLACHAGIQRFRWEHDRLPAQLEEARLGRLGVDPFTGGPLVYQLQGRAYQLRSVGPPTTTDNPRAIGGRAPIFVTQQ